MRMVLINQNGCAWLLLLTFGMTLTFIGGILLGPTAERGHSQAIQAWSGCVARPFCTDAWKWDGAGLKPTHMDPGADSVRWLDYGFLQADGVRFTSVCRRTSATASVESSGM